MKVNHKYKTLVLGKGNLFLGKKNKRDSITTYFENENQLLEFLKDVFPKTYIKIKEEVKKELINKLKQE